MTALGGHRPKVLIGFRGQRLGDVGGFRNEMVDVGEVRLRVRFGGQGPAVLLRLPGHDHYAMVGHDRGCYVGVPDGSTATRWLSGAVADCLIRFLTAPRNAP